MQGTNKSAGSWSDKETYMVDGLGSKTTRGASPLEGSPSSYVVLHHGKYASYVN